MRQENQQNRFCWFQWFARDCPITKSHLMVKLALLGHRCQKGSIISRGRWGRLRVNIDQVLQLQFYPWDGGNWQQLCRKCCFLVRAGMDACSLLPRIIMTFCVTWWLFGLFKACQIIDKLNITLPHVWPSLIYNYYYYTWWFISVWQSCTVDRDVDYMFPGSMV